VVHSSASDGRIAEGFSMKAYRLLVHDAREAAPSEWRAEMAHDSRAVEFARDRLAASAHLASIEVWAGAQRLCAFHREYARAA
jgi:hypothetical protein